MTKSLSFTVLALIATLLVFHFTSIDILLEDQFYNFDRAQWLIAKEAMVPRLFFYQGVKLLYLLFILAVALVLLFLRRLPWVIRYRQGLVVVLLSCLLVPLTVGSLKTLTNVPCPNNLQHYGGNYPYVTVFEPYPDSFNQPSKIACFPAGHASGGFALMALFFLFKSPRNRRRALLAAVVFGWVIGTYKMLIGEHFLSHTLVSMWVAWLVILLLQQLVTGTPSALRRRAAMTHRSKARTLNRLDNTSRF